MVPRQAGTTLRRLNHLLETESAREQTDAQLLQRFAARREEAAFAALLARHARLVWDVCRHTLGHHQDAEDAFQATFLILARRAGTIRKSASARINALAFSPDGKLVAAVTADGIVTVIDARTGKLLTEFKGHDGPVVSVAFMPDGTAVLSGGVDRTVRLWKVR